MTSRRKALIWQQTVLAIAAGTLLAVACGSDAESGPAVDEAGRGPDALGGAPAGQGGVGAARNDGGRSGAAAGGAGAAAAAATSAGAGSPGGDAGAAAGGVGSGGGGAGASDDSAAVAYRNDIAHSGKLMHELEPPLARLWSKTFDVAVSYPLIVGTRVFVSTRGDQGKPIVRAFDRLSGEALWSSESLATPSGFRAHIAYDRGQIFAADDDGYVMAVSAETGDIAWNVRLEPIYGFATMPVATGGVVLLTGATNDEKGKLFALDERDGSVMYRGVAQGVGHVTLGGSRAFTSGGCHETKAADLESGVELWHYQENCFGGGGERTVFDSDRLFVNDGGTTVALDAATGMLLGSIDAQSRVWPVSVVGDVALFAMLRSRGGEVRAYDLPSGIEAWSVRLDQTPVLPLLLTPGYAFVATRPTFGDTRLQAVDLHERAVVWTSAEPAATWDTGFTSSGTEPFQGIAAAQGCIATAFERTLSVFAPSE